MSTTEGTNKSLIIDERVDNSCGEIISDGESVREMLINLIFSE